MYNNLSELVREYPIGTIIRIEYQGKEDYLNKKFTVDGYIYESPEKWYPAHKLSEDKWEVYKG